MNTYKITVLAKLTIEIEAKSEDSAIKQLDTTELSEFKLVDLDIIEFENQGKSDNINLLFAEILDSWRR
jgi:hypothetical protein